MSLKSRLAILFFAISFLPSAAIGIMTYNNYAALYEQNKSQTLSYIADYKENTIELYFSGLVEDIKSTQHSWCIRENLPAIIEFYEDPSNPKFISSKKILDDRFQPTQNTWGLLDIMLVDTNGRVVYGTNPKHVHRSEPVPDPGEKSFKEGIKGVYITDVFRDPKEDGKPKMFISAPDFSSDGSLIGVIIFEVDMTRVYRIIQDLTGLGVTGETLIAKKTDNEAVYLNPLRHDPEAAFTKRIKIGNALGVPIQNAVQGQTGEGRTIDYRGVKVMAAWRYIPSLRWGLVAKIDTSEALKDVERLKNTLFFILALLFILSTIASRIIADTISGSRDRLNKEIGERKRAEKDLKEHKDHLEDLVKERTSEVSLLNKKIEFVLGATNTGLDIIDSDYNMVYIDPAWQKIYGDPKGRKCYEYFMSREAACPNCGVREALQTKKPVVTEEILAKEGNRPIQVTTIPYQDEKGNWLAAEVNVDITERKKTEEALNNYKNHLEALVEERTEEVRKSANALKKSVDDWQATFDGSSDMIFLLDRNMKIVKANLSAINFTGLPMNQLIGSKCHKVMHGTDDPISECPVTKAIENKRRESAELFISEKNIWVSIYADPILGKDGEVEGIVHTVRDITESKHNEAALEMSEINYRAIFDSASDAIIVRDIESYAMVDANEQACELLCYPKEEFLALPPEALFPEETLHSWKHIKPIFDKAASGEPQSVEIMLKDKAGRTFWVETHIKRAIIGGVYRLLSVAHDISERKDSEKQITELNASITRANEDLKKLALIDSHTGLYNYHYYSGVIEAEFARAQRQDGKLSLIMMDIDYFKSINDVYGHQFGDLLLKQFAEVLKKTVRLYDTVIRFGGEEFLIIAPGTGNEEVMRLAKRVLSAVESFPFGNAEHSVKLKISAASGSYPDDPRIKNSSDFIDIADSILGKAKEEGGNRAYSSLDYAPARGIDLGKEEPDVAFLKDKIGKLTTRGNQSVAEAIFAFAKTIELKDRYTGEHVDDTMHYAVLIAEKLGLDDREIELIKYAAALHDLGKVGIPESILHKAGKLTAEEFNVIKLHAQIGVDIIRPIHFLHDIIPAILHHHEHWDGSGYPTGLKKESIPLGSRIVAVADAYQAMVSDRPYRKSIGQEKAIMELKNGSGTQFDPKIVSMFINILLSEKKSSKYKKK